MCCPIEMTKEQIKERVRLALLSQPKTLTKIRSASASVAKWARTGFVAVSEKTYNERVSICDACEFWQPSGNLGMGKCLKCGCARGKLKIPHEKCPIGKWNSEPLTPPAPV